MLVTDRLGEIADYCRVDEDDAQLPLLALAAAGYLGAAGVKEPEAGSLRAEEYIQCVKYLTLDFYDRRDGSTDGTVGENPAFRRLLNQLKASEPLPSQEGSGEEEGGAACM